MGRTGETSNAAYCTTSNVGVICDW